MGRYATPDEIIQRYPSLKGTGAAVIDSAFVLYAENDVDGLLGRHFTTPFSSNNITVRDLVIDMTYLRAASLKPSEQEKRQADIDRRVADLIGGNVGMLVSSGSPIYSAGGGAAYSTTADYHSVFDLLPIEDQGPDVDQLDAEVNRRA